MWMSGPCAVSYTHLSDRETTLAETMALAQKIEKSGQITIFMPNTGEDEVDRGFVTIGRYIYSYKDLRALGYFLMSIRSTELDQIWENKDLSRIRILVLDEDGRAVYGTCLLYTSFWFHFPVDMKTDSKCVDDHLDFYRRCDTDFIKIMCDGYFDYPNPIIPEIREPKDWYKMCIRDRP